MQLHPNIDCYFIQYDPFVRVPTIQSNTLFLRGVERYGLITAKTLEALDYFLRRKSYDYIVRTNLSSVWDFKNLLAFLEPKPRTGFYSGQLNVAGSITFASGAGFILSQDVAHLLVRNGNDIAKWTQIPDDVVIAIRLRDLGIHPVSQPRVDFGSLDQYLQHNNKIPPGTFHYRMKHVQYETHRAEEPVMMQRLLNDHILKPNPI